MPERCTDPNCLVHGTNQGMSGIATEEDFMRMLMSKMSTRMGTPGAMTTGERRHAPNTDCDCPNCQEHSWKKRGNSTPFLRFRKGEKMFFVFPLKHYGKIKKLITLRAALKEIKSDLETLGRIINDKEASAYNDLSKEIQTQLILCAEVIRAEVKTDGTEDAQEIVEYLVSIERFISVLVGEKTFKNEVLYCLLMELKGSIVKDNPIEEIEKEVAQLESELPKELRNVTEPPKLEVPFEDLESIIRTHIEANSTD